MSPKHASPFALSLLLIACAAPPATGTAGDDIAAPSRAADPTTPAPAPTTSELPPVAPATPTTDAGASPRSTNCPASVPAPIFCDGFDGVLDPSWNRRAFGGDVDLDPQRAATGAKSLRVGFDPLPDAGLAQIELRDTAIATAPHVSMRFQLFLPRDAYPSKLPLGGLYDQYGRGVRLALDANANLVAEDVRPDPGGIQPIASLPFAVGRWACVVVSYDRANGAVSLRTDTVIGFGTTSNDAIDRADLGLTYLDGANDKASIAGWYDDVAISATDLACP